MSELTPGPGSNPSWYFVNWDTRGLGSSCVNKGDIPSLPGLLWDSVRDTRASPTMSAQQQKLLLTVVPEKGVLSPGLMCSGEENNHLGNTKIRIEALRWRKEQKEFPFMTRQFWKRLFNHRQKRAPCASHCLHLLRGLAKSFLPWAAHRAGWGGRSTHTLCLGGESQGSEKPLMYSRAHSPQSCSTARRNH